MSSDIEESKPLERAKAKTINARCFPIIPLSLMRYEALADFYTEEPKIIRVRENENDQPVDLEQVFRFRKWVPNKTTYSWSIYCDNRNWINENVNGSKLVLRHAIWDKQNDQRGIKTLRSNNQEGPVFSWPRLSANTYYLYSTNVPKMNEALLELERILENGLTLFLRNNEWDWPGWNDLEVMRLFDWGQLHMTWSPVKINNKVEKLLITIENMMQSFAIVGGQEVSQIDLDYTFPPDLFKNSVYGI